MTNRNFEGGRLYATWASYRSLPGWVQVWVGLILVPANILPFFFLDTWTGQAAAIAAIFVVATNLPIMLWYAGMNALMSIPHLIAWIPLEVALALRVSGMAGIEPVSDTELLLAVTLLVVNGISLAFDFLDSYKWLMGERETPRPDFNRATEK